MRCLGLPAQDLVGARAVDVARREVLFLGLVVLHVGGLVLLGPNLAHDAKVDDVAQQDRVRRRQDHVDRVVVDLLDVADAGDVDLHRALRLPDAAEAEDHVVGGERRAVVKLDAVAQLEAHLRGADEGPLGGQAGLDLVLLVVAGQALVGVHQDRVGRRMILRVRVERQDVVLRRPAQIGGMQRCGHGQHHGRSGQQGLQSHGELLFGEGNHRRRPCWTRRPDKPSGRPGRRPARSGHSATWRASRASR